MIINKVPVIPKEDRVLGLILARGLKILTGMIVILTGIMKMNMSGMIRTIYGKKRSSRLNVQNGRNRNSLKRKSNLTGQKKRLINKGLTKIRKVRLKKKKCRHPKMKRWMRMKKVL